jgi:hypothetical protein
MPALSLRPSFGSFNEALNDLETQPEYNPDGQTPPPPPSSPDITPWPKEFVPIDRFYLLTSGPFGDSMSAAARPKRWGVFR